MEHDVTQLTHILQPSYFSSEEFLSLSEHMNV